MFKKVDKLTLIIIVFVAVVLLFLFVPILYKYLLYFIGGYAALFAVLYILDWIIACHSDKPEEERVSLSGPLALMFIVIWPIIEAAAVAGLLSAIL